MSDVNGVRLQTPPKKTKKSLHDTLRRVLGKIGVLMQNRTRAEIINNESDESMSIFNEERKEYFLEHLQESMLHHAAIRDRAEKLAVHMGISIGDAANQLKAHLVQEVQEAAKKKKKGNPFDTEIGMRSHEKIPDPLSRPDGEYTTSQIKGDIADRTVARKLMKKPKLPESVKESFREFIAEYESVLAENGIEEYDLDEATEYFVGFDNMKRLLEELETITEMAGNDTSEEIHNNLKKITDKHLANFKDIHKPEYQEKTESISKCLHHLGQHQLHMKHAEEASSQGEGRAAKQHTEMAAAHMNQLSKHAKHIGLDVEEIHRNTEGGVKDAKTPTLKPMNKIA